MNYSYPSGGSAGSQNIAGHKLKSVPNFTPQQMHLFQSLLGGVGGGANQGLGYLSRLASGEEGAFEQQEAPAYSAFNKTLGQIGSRFSQYGAQDSSAFQNALSGAGSQLAQNLQGNRSQIQQDAINRLLGFSQSLLAQNPYENILQQNPQKRGFDFGGILGSVLPSIVSALL